MKTDIQIAQEAKLQHIGDVAKKLSISEDDLSLRGIRQSCLMSYG